MLDYSQHYYDWLKEEYPCKVTTLTGGMILKEYTSNTQKFDLAENFYDERQNKLFKRDKKDVISLLNELFEIRKNKKPYPEESYILLCEILSSAITAMSGTRDRIPKKNNTNKSEVDRLIKKIKEGSIPEDKHDLIDSLIEFTINELPKDNPRITLPCKQDTTKKYKSSLIDQYNIDHTLSLIRPTVNLYCKYKEENKDKDHNTLCKRVIDSYIFLSKFAFEQSHITKNDELNILEEKEERAAHVSSWNRLKPEDKESVKEAYKSYPPEISLMTEKARTAFLVVLRHPNKIWIYNQIRNNLKRLIQPALDSLSE